MLMSSICTSERDGEGEMTMVPNADRIFWHEDDDKDSLEILGSGDNSERLTALITQEDGRPEGVYLDRTAARGLRDALTRWLGSPIEATSSAPVDSAESETPDPESCTGAPYRLEALRLALEFTSVAVPALELLGVADVFARYLASGEIPEAAQPASVAVANTPRTAEPPVSTCLNCGHPYHGIVLCADRTEAFRPRCPCRGLELEA